VDVFWHDDVSHYDKSIALAGLFQNREESVAAARGAEKRQPPVARTSDKVQVLGTLTAVQAAGHNTK
jgi:hypothetical protein